MDLVPVVQVWDSTCMLSPLSKNLFHGAISESGVSVASWANVTGKIAKEKTMQLAKNTGCNHNELAEIVQ